MNDKEKLEAHEETIKGLVPVIYTEMGFFFLLPYH